MTFLSVSTPSISESICGTMVFSTSDEMPGASHPEDRVHLVEEDDHREALLGLLLGALEDQSDLALGLADVLVEQLGTLDVQEVRVRVGPAGPLGDLLGQRVGDRLGDQRLAASGRAVQQNALRRRELVLLEDLRVEERQLDGVLDVLDLRTEAADVLVA